MAGLYIDSYPLLFSPSSVCLYNASLAKEKPLAEGMKAVQLLQKLVKKGNFRQQIVI